MDLKTIGEGLDLPEKVAGAIGALVALYHLLPRLYRVLLKFYKGMEFMIDSRVHLDAMEKRLLEAISRLDDGQINIIEIRRHIIDADPCTAYFFTDEHGHTIWVTKTWTLWTGIDNNAARGSGWENGICAKDRARVILAWQMAIDHQRRFEDVYSYVDRDGNETEVTVVAEPIRRKDGGIMNWFGSARKAGHEFTPPILASPEPQ